MADKKSSVDDSLYIIEKCSVRDVSEWKNLGKRLDWYHYANYAYYANERSIRAAELKQALLSVAKPFAFDKWFRVTQHKWSNHPLSATGSVRNLTGGRFNIGSIDPAKFPKFPALYMADTVETAFIEAYGPRDKRSGKFETTLLSESSATHVRIKGNIDLIFDLTESESLEPMIEILSEIKTPRQLLRMAKDLKVTPMQAIHNVDELYGSLMDPNWRETPMAVDVPANCQIFGQMVLNAGIGGILYKSVSTQSLCLAIFPESVVNSGSSVSLVDDLPAECIHKILNASTFKNFC